MYIVDGIWIPLREVNVFEKTAHGVEDEDQGFYSERKYMEVLANCSAWKVITILNFKMFSMKLCAEPALFHCLKTSEKSSTQIIDMILKKSSKSLCPFLFCVRQNKKNHCWGWDHSKTQSLARIENENYSPTWKHQLINIFLKVGWWGKSTDFQFLKG